MAGVPKEGEAVSGVYDSIVVGAGIMGSCTAYQVAKRGKSVLLLEQYDFLHHRGSSHGESRTIRVTYPELYYTKMMKEAYQLWEEAENEAGYMVYHQTGQLDFGPHDSESLRSVVSNLTEENIDHQVLTHQECKARFSSLSLPKDSLIVYTKQGGIIRASKAVAMFQSLALRHGATLRDRAKLLRISPHWKLPDGSDGVLVATSRGAALARSCIVAAGAWAPQIVKELSGVQLPVEPLHTSIAYWEVINSIPDVLSAAKGFPVFADYGKPYIYGTPSIEYPGLIKVSVHSGTPCDPNKRMVVPDMELLKKEVSPWLASRFEGNVKFEAPVMAQGCMYSMTPDEDFILDFLPLSAGKGQAETNLHSCAILVAAGFSGHGFKMGPLVGRIMADLALSGTAPGVPLEVFSIKRFAKNALGNQKEESQVKPALLQCMSSN
ncbi:hypothetical protein KC19_7G128800 [Ceratodon purpureus]|uniref:sarcosine oxidasee (formaldehyde-forming) n=1 Tax=Ceratodon purpureus TaxID=3225 RepID=A0A8T0H925_CERPU|nr:hypothetical protein KC19_7G128800 [Ceratodon purpureus]